MLKIDIISGFLGAGKTTFIKRLLKTNIKNEKVVLIENEFGQISVDSAFLSEAGIQIKELSQGCICCSLVGDFAKSLNEVIKQFNPERIIIEPSGVGKLSDIKNAVISAELGEYLNSFVCLVDAQRAKMYLRNFGEFFKDQIESASTVVLSRTDVAQSDKIDEALHIIRDLNPTANIISTHIDLLGDEDLVNSYEGIDKNQLEKLIAEALEEHEEHHHHHHHHHHDEDECDDPECECHHHDEEECDDPECECHHHHHHDEDECDDPECECHHHHHHDEDECDDPECECHHHHHHHDEEECDDPECECHHHHHHHDEDECDDPECECHHHHHHHDEDECDDPECECHHHHHHHGHDADEVFETVGMETGKIYDVVWLADTLNTFANTEDYGLIVRAKGIVNTNNGYKEFNLSPNEVSITDGKAPITGMIVVIGSHLKKQEIKNLF